MVTGIRKMTRELRLTIFSDMGHLMPWEIEEREVSVNNNNHENGSWEKLPSEMGWDALPPGVWKDACHTYVRPYSRRWLGMDTLDFVLEPGAPETYVIPGERWRAAPSTWWEQAPWCKRATWRDVSAVHVVLSEIPRNRVRSEEPFEQPSRDDVSVGVL